MGDMGVMNGMLGGGLPARFRRERVLVVGCGDVGLRVVSRLSVSLGRLALSATPERLPLLRQKGLIPLLGNLDAPSSLCRLAGLATRVLFLAPPPAVGRADTRSRNMAHALARRSPPKAVVYASTSGVYGDCQGAKVNESARVAPDTPRAIRRVDAEQTWRVYGAGHSPLGQGKRVSILRVPGIYAPDRSHGLGAERLRKAQPVLRQEDDVYTNHIHADDLARACLRALWRGKAQRVYNVNDDSVLRMGAYFDLLAQWHGLAPPPRIAKNSAAFAALLPMVQSFMSASRLLDNTRMKRELGLRLGYPTVQAALFKHPQATERSL